jgi:hypothetical protein
MHAMAHASGAVNLNLTAFYEVVINEVVGGDGDGGGFGLWYCGVHAF